MGNGMMENIRDIVYVKMDNFNRANNLKISVEIEQLNSKLEKLNRNYVLAGPGRWGSSDPWLGIPVKWAQISSARLITELGMEDYKIDPSQGTHFFHNLTSFGVGYLTINTNINSGKFNLKYLDSLPAENDSDNIRHIRFKEPLRIEIDGRNTKGIVCKP